MSITPLTRGDVTLSELGVSRLVWDTVKSQLAPKGCPDEVLALSFMWCKRSGADPTAKHLYIVNRKDHGNDSWRIESYADFFRAVAHASGEYDGFEGPEYCGDDGVWIDTWLSSTPPSAARIKVFRKGVAHTGWTTARYSAYYGNSPNFLKNSMGEVLIAKVAEVLAIRRMFPQQLAGLYTAEEMKQADNAGTVYPTGVAEPATLDGATVSDAAQAPDNEGATRAAKARQRAEKPLTVTDLRKSFEVLSLLGEKRSLGVYLSDCGDKWLKPGAKPLKERSQSKTMLSDAEVLAANVVIQADIARRKAPVDEQIGVQQDTVGGEYIDPDTEVLYCQDPMCGAQLSPPAVAEPHHPGCPLDPNYVAPADLPKPTEAHLTQLAIALLNRFGRKEGEKAEWLYAVLGVDSLDKIATESDVNLALKEATKK